MREHTYDHKPARCRVFTHEFSAFPVLSLIRPRLAAPRSPRRNAARDLLTANVRAGRMALYNTVPAEESTLLAPKKSNKVKGLAVGAALVAFVLGAVAATAIVRPRALFFFGRPCRLWFPRFLRSKGSMKHGGRPRRRPGLPGSSTRPYHGHRRPWASTCRPYCVFLTHR